MSVITCRKCGTTTKYVDQPPVSCTTCGAVYAKVEAFQASRHPIGPAPALFIDELRAGTLYPTFRSVVRLLTVLLYLIGVLFALGGLVGAFNGGGIAAFIGGLVAGLIFYVLGRLSQEASTMLADLSDAAVHIAEHVRRGDRTQG